MALIRRLAIFAAIIGHIGLVLTSFSHNPASSRRSLPNRNDEPIPAETDAYIAHLVDIMNAPEPWDHL